MGSIKKLPKCVKYWNMLAIKGLYLDISDWFWLFGRSKYIELSRNREARIFKHILLNEIDLQFQHTLKAEIVLHEIQQGRIPLIIDGFDELLSKDISEPAANRNAESMLKTLVDLLDSKAKIIITSRRTALFNGEEFFEWMQQSSKKYQVARYSLATPQISDWLAPEQIKILEEANIPINNISNPVLLSYIRNTSETELENLLHSRNTIIDKYFKFILNRERERQDISFTNEEQLRILRKLVRIMTEFNIKSESKSFIKEIIKEYNINLLNEYIKKTNQLPKPTLDEITDTLSNHALLDRKQNDEIGFINEFILGLLIGQNLVFKKYQEHNPSTYQDIIHQDLAALAVASYMSESDERKLELWEILNDKKFKYTDDFNLYKNICLRNEVNESYSESIVFDLNIENTTFKSSCIFKNFIFSDCTFQQCKFSTPIQFLNSGFINCKFFNCSWEDETNDNPKIEYRPYFSGCYCPDNFLQKYEDAEDDITDESINDISLEQIILEHFIKDGKKYKDMVNLSKMRNNFSNKQKLFDKTINQMNNAKLIALNGGKCFLLKDAVPYYREHYYHN